MISIFFRIAKIVHTYREKINDKSKNAKIESYARTAAKCVKDYVKKMEKIKIKYNLDAVEDDTDSEESDQDVEDKKRKKKQLSTNTKKKIDYNSEDYVCLLYTSPSPRDRQKSRMPSSA